MVTRFDATARADALRKMPGFPRHLPLSLFVHPFGYSLATVPGRCLLGVHRAALVVDGQPMFWDH